MKELLLGFMIIDLTHGLCEDIPNWEGTNGFCEHIDVDYEHGARIMRYEMFAGIGTHMDAPGHYVKGAENIADIEPEKLFVNACVINVSEQAQDNSEYFLSVDEVKKWEERNGAIEKNSLFLVYTGWSKRWPDVQKYRNVGKDGKMHFPGMSAQVADFLLERGVVAIGIDTLSPDGGDYTFPVHKKMLGARKYMLENVAHLEKMPEIGAYVCVAPLKIKNGTESSVRLFGFVKKK